MSDDTNNVGAQDRSRIAGHQEHEVRYFADKHGITVEQAQQLIAQHGNNRGALDNAARRMKG
ncbi:DUF3606 domain-containing protein [Novosphingobium tardum]|uniref:DUF3606 domain-containing protein n=1 Tax=Novosphingobium tardum TaxID=1538021 RepID=A0ABV8RJL8_9SPHN